MRHNPVKYRNPFPYRHPLRHAPRARLVAGLALAAATVVLLLVADPAPALAAQVAPWAAPKNLADILSGIRTWLMTILAGIATVFLTVGGVRYLMAGGDPSEVERAKSAFKSAGIGYALAIIAPVVLTILNSIVGTPQ